MDASLTNFGGDHTETARCLETLGEYYLARGRNDRALEKSLAAAEIVGEHRRRAVATLDQRDALALVEMPQPGLATACAVALEQKVGVGVEQVWDRLMRDRGLVFEEMAARRLTVAEARRLDLEHVDRELQKTTADLVHTASLSNLYATESAASWEPADLRLDEQRRIEEARDDAERRLRTASARLRNVGQRQRLRLDDAWRMMPEDSGLVAFYRTAPHPGRAIAPEYLAFVKRRDQLDPDVRSLGSADEIDALVESWRLAIERARVRGSEYLTEEDRLCRDVRNAGTRLRERIWDPLDRELDGVDVVFLVPDGALALVGFATLPTGDDGYLIDDEPDFHYLSSERDLVPPHVSPGRAAGMLAVGDPDYDASPTATAASRGPAPHTGMSFARLPETHVEAEETVALWADRGAVDLLVGREATEEAVRRKAAGRRIVHLATHGFFMDPDDSPDSAARPGAALFARNPLLTTGLALAGANHTAETAPGRNDGILTAEEISLLDLSGCEWVVLSACETGLGVISRVDGVMGLRRAFQLAGARTVVMSLWKIDDDAARRLVELLYEARLERGESTFEALRDASRRVLAERRDAGLRTLPVDWGAFVAVGDWR